MARIVRWLPALLLTLAGPIVLRAESPPAPAPAPASPALTEPAPAQPPWGRIYLVGASASAGFTETELFGGTNTARYRLSRYLDAALRVPHEPVRNLATSLFFFQPLAQGRRQIAQAIRAKPTLVIGLDFLFWYCYGEGLSDAERQELFEEGLNLLETVPCPLVVGDIPDASAAVGGMLTLGQMPSAHAMSAANRRLKEWAAARKQVVIVPLADFMRAAMANRAVTIHGRTLAPGSTRRLLQSDKLHPSALGSAVLSLAVLDAFLAAHPAVPATDVRWDAGEVLRLGLNSLSAVSTNSARTPVPATMP